MSGTCRRISSSFSAGIFLVLALTLVIALACGGEADTPIPTLSPTAVPTLVPSPTAAPSPIAAPAPTSVPSPTATPSPYPLTVIGSNGKAVTFTGPPERIVAIDSAAVEALFAIGEGDRVVGTHDFVTFPPETAQVQKVGSAFALNLEQIAILEPDLIYIFFESPVADLETLGIPVLYLDPPADFGEVADSIRLWGEIIDEVEKADGLALDFEASIAEIQERLSNVSEGPRVYHDEAPGLWTTGSGSLADQVYSLLKAENVFRDMEGYAQISAEELVARDPQVIISLHDEGPEIFRGNPAFSGISAVVNGRLIAIDGSLLGVPGPRVVLGIEAIARALYPDLFE